MIIIALQHKILPSTKVSVICPITIDKTGHPAPWIRENTDPTNMRNLSQHVA
jgi:hypothetical protein